MGSPAPREKPVAGQAVSTEEAFSPLAHIGWCSGKADVNLNEGGMRVTCEQSRLECSLSQLMDIPHLGTEGIRVKYRFEFPSEQMMRCETVFIETNLRPVEYHLRGFHEPEKKYLRGKIALEFEFLVSACWPAGSSAPVVKFMVRSRILHFWDDSELAQWANQKKVASDDEPVQILPNVPADVMSVDRRGYEAEKWLYTVLDAPAGFRGWIIRYATENEEEIKERPLVVSVVHGYVVPVPENASWPGPR